MTQSPSTVPENKSGTEQPDLTPQENKARDKAKEKLKFYGFVALLVIMCIVFIWFIFKPDNSKQDQGMAGLNFSIPEASLQENEGDKRKALELTEIQDKQRERVRNLMDFDNNTIEQSALQTDIPELTQSSGGRKDADDPIRQSQQAAARLNDQMRSFYEQPREDPEVAELKRQLEELTLQMRLQNEIATPQAVDEIALLEKTFEMASRYMPGQGSDVKSIPEKANASKDRNVVGARRAEDNPVSSLMEFELTPQERNYGFVTAEGTENIAVSNAIRACINEDQVITMGAQVRMRLLEPLRVGSYLIPVNAPIYGNARIDGQRLAIVIESIETEGNIIPVELIVHDMDGQRGLNVPNSMERTAAKDALANVGQGFGTSISFAESAAQQIAMDLTRGVMSGASQYLSSKMREVKINLKAGYQVLLIAKQ